MIIVMAAFEAILRIWLENFGGIYITIGVCGNHHGNYVNDVH